MSPAARFHALVATLTIFTMFWLITYAVPALWAYVNPASINDVRISALISGFLTLVGSVGTYRLLAWGLGWILHRSLKVRSWIFGANFLHGTWVGFFVGHARDKRYVVEKFDQDLDGLVINGRSYDINLQLHGQWTSEATSVDARRGRLMYTYSFTVGARSIDLSGICTFQFDRSASYEAPHSITGYAHDLNDPTRIKVQEVKICNELLSWEQALKVAVKRFP